MRADTKMVLFAAMLGLVCSALLAGVSWFTAPYRADNERVEEVRNILAALDVPIAPQAGQHELLAIFNRNIRKKTLGDLALFEYVPEGAGRPAGVAVPFTGAGLWGPVSGVLALEPDLRTIRGLRFYRQEETPGLGGEISSEWFQKQFAGRRIVSSGGEPGFRVVKPEAPTDANSVEGITGATMTSDRVQTMLANLAKNIDRERGRYAQ